MIQQQTHEGDLVVTGQVTALGGVNDPRLTNTITQVEQSTVKAQQASVEISTLISDISSDNLITPVEKKELARTWEGIKYEYPKVLIQANTRGIAADAATRLAYIEAYTVLVEQLETGASPILGDMSANSTVVGATFRGQWATYYQTRQELMGAIEGETVGKAEYLAGFTGSGGTLTPTAPTLGGSCLFQTAYLAWNPQTDLTGQITHRVYRAEAAGGPFVQIAEVSAYLYQDSGLALEGTEDAPEPKAYWYKVSRVVNGATESAASSAVMVTASPVPTGSIEAASIKAIKIDLENLFAQMIKVQAGGSFRAGDRYNTDGTVADANAAGIFIGANGQFKGGSASAEIDISGDSEGFSAYTGAGVQRRAVRLADEKIDWLDAPAGGSELLQARIGRLGVGSAILMDGEFRAPVSKPWGAANAINIASSGYPAYIKTNENQVRIAYIDNASGGRLKERILSAGGWGSAIDIEIYGAYEPSYIQDKNGNIRISYRLQSNNSIVERIFNGSTWGEAIVVSSTGGFDPVYVQTNDSLKIYYNTLTERYIVERIHDGISWGAETAIITSQSYYIDAHYEDTNNTIRIAYQRGSDGYLVERIHNGTSWGAESVINNSAGSYPAYIKDIDGNIRIAYQRGSDGYLVERIHNGTSWGAESVINNAISDSPALIQEDNGDMRVAYIRNTDNYLLERTLQRYAKLGAGIIEAGDDQKGRYLVTSTGDTIRPTDKVIDQSVSVAYSGYKATGILLPDLASAVFEITALYVAASSYCGKYVAYSNASKVYRGASLNEINVAISLGGTNNREIYISQSSGSTISIRVIVRAIS